MLVLPARLELATTRFSTVCVCQLRHDRIMNWYSRRDSNPHCLVPKTSASSRLGYAGRSIAKIWIAEFGFNSSTTFEQIRNPNFAVRHFAWWTWHDLNVRPRPSQSRALIPLSYRSKELAEATGLEPARALRGDLANRCHTVRRRLLRFWIADFGLRIDIRPVIFVFKSAFRIQQSSIGWRKGQESNLQATTRGS